MDILIVEDDKLLRAVFRNLMTRAHFSLRDASSGIEGLRRIEEKIPSLILTDAMMPELDGLSMLKIINGTRKQKIPAILISAITSPISQSDREEMGIIRIFSKPFSFDALMKEIVTIMKNQKKGV